jgi:hypothetical protein
LFGDEKMSRNPMDYFYNIHKMEFQGPEGKLGSWILELGNNSIEYGANNVDVELPDDKRILIHDDGDGIEKNIFATLFGLIKGKNHGDTFNRWNEGSKKILTRCSEMYVETRCNGYFDGGIFKWKDATTGQPIDYYDPTHLPEPLPIDDWTLLREKRNIMKYPNGTTWDAKLMFNEDKKQRKKENIEQLYKKYYHLLINGIQYRKMTFHVCGQIVTHELNNYTTEKMKFEINVYKNGKPKKEKITIPVLIFKSEKPLPEDYRGVYIVVNGIRLEEIKINIPSDMEENYLIYFCADFFTRKDLSEDEQGILGRDKTNVLDSATKKDFIREAKITVKHMIGENKGTEEKSKTINELNKKLKNLVNTKKWKNLLKLPREPPVNPPQPRAEPECETCHTKNFKTWDEDERYNICENGHTWLKREKWERKCPKCKSFDYETKVDGEKEIFTCKKCGYTWKKDKRPIHHKQDLTVAFSDGTKASPPWFMEVRYDAKINVIYLNTGVPTCLSVETKLGQEHYFKCMAKQLSEIICEMHEWEEETQGMKLYYDAYMDLKGFTNKEKEKYKQQVLVTT